MKITQVEAIEVRLPESEVKNKASAAQDALIIKVHTDEGIVGVGFAIYYIIKGMQGG